MIEPIHDFFFINFFFWILVHYYLYTLRFLPFLQINEVNTFLNTAMSSSPLIYNTWQFLAATFDGFTINIYINGILNGSVSQMYALPTINRAFNYIGKSNWNNDGYSFSYIDDLRFYNIS